ncbi:MAG: metallophosphoesterase family protein [Myxococcales bacterium]
MRLAVISDVHGNLRALEAVLADIDERAPDAIVNLGDCVTSPLWPRETLELLESRSLPTVRGNHDRWLADPASTSSGGSVVFARDALTVAQRATLGALPPTVALDDGVLAVHGTPASDVSYLLEDKVDGRLSFVTAETLGARLDGVRANLVLCGHSHTQHVAADSAGRLVVNPGSVGCPRYADNIDRLSNEAGSPHARYAVATRRGARWSIELVVLDYDWFEVARQAERNGRPDWARGFLGA